jgi:small-conductance mechanosensitive channel
MSSSSFLKSAQMFRRLEFSLLLLLLLVSDPIAVIAQPLPRVTPTPVSESVLIVERAPVKIDGKVLFYLRRGGDFSAQERAALFNDRLKKIIETSEEAPKAIVRQHHKAYVVHLAQSVFTVTPLDAEEHQMSSEEVAYFWAGELQEAIDSAHAARSPESLGRAFLQIGGGFLVVLLVHILLGLHWRNKARDVENPPSAWTLFLLRLSFWWAWGYLVVLTLPYTRHLLVPFLKAETIGGAALGSLLLIQFGLDRWLRAPLAELLARRGKAFRVERRAQAILRFFKGVLAAIILIVSTLGILGVLGLSTAPFVASLGILGLVLGLAAQGLVKDVVAGMLILLEDKFGIGDWVNVGNRDGEVVGLTLHVTTLRNLAGDIISIPNGTINTVINYTQDWSAIDFRASVSHGSDIESALQALKAAADRLRQEFPDQISEEAQVLGVESIEVTGPVLRVLVKVVPGEQWNLGRQLRRILITEFQKAGVIFGQQRLQLAPGSADPASTPSSS